MSARLLAAAALAAGAWLLYRQSQDTAAPAFAGAAIDGAGDALTAAYSSAADFIDSATGGLMKISRMREASPDMLREANVAAFLRTIRAGEGTAGPDGYRTLYGGRLFSGYADHPRVTVTAGAWTSTAAGAYQFLASTWDETRAVMGLPDFSPASQDLGALGRIAARGALEDVRAGRFADAIRKCAREWASLPGSPYGQPTLSMDRARAVYLAAGGADIYA